MKEERRGEIPRSSRTEDVCVKEERRGEIPFSSDMHIIYVCVYQLCTCTRNHATRILFSFFFKN